MRDDSLVRALFFVGITLLVACGNEPSEPAVDPREARALTEIERARDEIAAFRASAEAQLENVASHEEALNKARRVFEGLHVTQRIPEARDETSIEAALNEAAREAHMTVANLRVQPRAREERTLPAQVATTENFRFREDDLREVLEVTFELSPAEIDKLEAFNRDLLSSEPRRFVVPRHAVASPRAFTITADAFRFVATAYPSVVLLPPDEARVLDRPELGEVLPAVRDRPAVRAALEGLRADLRALEPLVPRVNAALAPIAETNFIVARTAILERRAAEAGSRTTADLLGP